MHWLKRHVALILFLLVVIVGSALSSRIGTAWDEPDNMYAGGVYVNFFTHGFDPSYFTNLTNEASAYGKRIFPNDRMLAHLPPVHNYVGALFVLAAQALHIPPTAHVIIISWHLATVLFFALMVAMTYRFGVLLGLSFWSGLFAALAVFLYPQLFGHGLSNSKDIAQASMVITSLYYLMKKNLLIGAVVWGLGMATKFNAVYVPIIWALWMVMTHKKYIIHYLLFILVVGCATTVLAWPYLWFDTLSRIMEVVTYFTTVGRGYRVVWDGMWYNVGAGIPLWWYPPVSFLYTTPLLLLALFFWGLGILVRHRAQKSVWIMLPIWIGIPLIRTLSPWSAFYDLLRHFLEIVPAVMLIAALGLEWFFQKKQHLLLTGIMLGGIIIGQMIYINTTLFPYSTGYYNVFARNPNVNFDRDIEALSIKEAMEYVYKTYGNVRVFCTLGGHQSWYYLAPDQQYVFTKNEADVVIVVNKVSHRTLFTSPSDTLPGFSMVHEIRRADAIFGRIYKRTGK